MKNVRNVMVERVFTIWGIVVILWSFYRVQTHFSEGLDELIFKPLIFLGPMLWYVLQIEKRRISSIGIAKGHLRRDVVLGLIFGMVFVGEAIVTNFAKTGRFSLVPAMPVGIITLISILGLGLVTSIVEETFVRGFLFTRLKEGYKSELKALVVSTGMYFLLLVPVVFTVLHLTGTSLLLFTITNFIISFTNTMIFNETKTLTVPVMIHWFWNVVVGLYL